MKKMNRWVYAIFGVAGMLIAGLIYTWSVMSKPIAAARLDWTSTRLSLTFTLVMAFFCVGNLISGILIKKISARIFLIMACILILAGFLIASMTQSSPALLYIGFGVLCGLGAGFVYVPTMSTLSAWFPDKQGLISGILLMGFGISSFIFGLVYAAVTPSDGSDAWCTTFRYIGIIACVVVLICSFFIKKPGADYNPPKPKKEKPVREPALDIGPGKMLRKPVFWFFYIWAIFMSAAGLALTGHATGVVGQVSSTMADRPIAMIVGIISICNGCGRVIFGAVFDKKGYKFTMLTVMAIYLSSGILLCLAVLTNILALVVIGFICGGLAFGGAIPMLSTVISDFFGRTNYSINYSIATTNLMIASITSTIAGRLYDMSGTYLTTTLIMVVVAVCAFIAFIGVRRPKPEDQTKVEA